MNNLDLALKDLINQMTHGMPERVRIQLSVRFPHSDKQPHTELLVKRDAIDMTGFHLQFSIGKSKYLMLQ